MAPSRAAARELVTVPRDDWQTVRDFFTREHRLGEHVAAEGPNGSGKSTLMLELLKARSAKIAADRRPVRATVLAVKPRDETLTRLGWKRITSLKDWPPQYGDEHVTVWPVYGDDRTAAARQRAIMQPVLSEIMASGSQIVYIDEAAYFEEPQPTGLGLARQLNQYWYFSRSNGVSLFAGTQRPRRVSRSMWAEPYWLFLFRPEDEDDLKRVAQLSGRKQLVMDVLPTLGPHEFLMLRRRPKSAAVISEVRL